MRDVLQPLRVRGFARLASSYTLNELADWMATIALSVLVFDATGDPLATTALFIAMKFVPGFLVPVLTARLERRPVGLLLGVLYTVEAAALATAAVTSGTFSLPVILVLALIGGTVAATAQATTRSATFGVLNPANQLRAGNALMNMGFSAMNVAGPALAGLLVAATSARAGIAVAAALFGVQAIVMVTARGLSSGDAEGAPWGARLREGFAYVSADRRRRTLLVGQGLVLLLLTMITPIEVVYAKETLEAGDSGLGLLLGSWGVGMVLGSWLFARERSRSLPVLIAFGTIAMAVGYLGMAVAPTLAVACVASAIGGLGNGMQWVAVVTALQEATDDAFQARVAGLFEAVSTVAPGLGFLIGGLITAALSPRIAFGVSGGGVLVLLLVGAFVLARDRAARGPVVAREPLPEPTG